jgi:hypothetical protein
MPSIVVGLLRNDGSDSGRTNKEFREAMSIFMQFRPLPKANAG